MRRIATFLTLIVAFCFINVGLFTNTVCAQTVSNQMSEKIDILTQQICHDIPDRTSFTASAQKAALWITEYLNGIGVQSQTQQFSVDVTVQKNLSIETKTETSCNSVGFIDKGKNNTVLITTNLGNHYTSNSWIYGTGVAGALNNAASVAAVLCLAEYYVSADCDYNLAFAFFTGTDEGNYGSKHYLDKLERTDIIFVINMERLGCGTTYYYNDEVNTEHGKLTELVAENYSNIKEFPMTGRVIFPGELIDGVSYYNYANRGDIASFMSIGKACLELIGGDFTGLSDGEGGLVYLSNTKLDTYENLLKYYSDYSSKLNDVCSFVIELCKMDLTAITGAADEYKIFTQEWVGYVIALGVLCLAVIVMIVLSNVFTKKYPLPKQRKLKIAVFGAEYEDASEDIIVDFKSGKNPFDM